MLRVISNLSVCGSIIAVVSTSLYLISLFSRTNAFKLMAAVAPDTFLIVIVSCVMGLVFSVLNLFIKDDYIGIYRAVLGLNIVVSFIYMGLIIMGKFGASSWELF